MPPPLTQYLLYCATLTCSYLHWRLARMLTAAHAARRQVMDRDVGNTGGLGGLYGIMYAIGRPLPFREAQPWRMSRRYKLFQAVGNFVGRAAAKKE